MEMQSQRKHPSNETRGYQDQQAALIRDLSPLVQITGRALAIKIMRKDLLNLDVDRSHLVAVCRFLRDQLGFELLSSISGVDMLDHLEAVYHLRSFARRQILQLRVGVDNEMPEVDSVVSVWPTANWSQWTEFCPMAASGCKMGAFSKAITGSSCGALPSPRMRRGRFGHLAASSRGLPPQRADAQGLLRTRIVRARLSQRHRRGPAWPSHRW